MTGSMDFNIKDPLDLLEFYRESQVISNTFIGCSIQSGYFVLFPSYSYSLKSNKYHLTVLEGIPNKRKNIFKTLYFLYIQKYLTK